MLSEKFKKKHPLLNYWLSGGVERIHKSQIGKSLISKLLSL